MAPETLLAIISFATSVGGLVPLLFLRDRLKQLGLAVVVALLIALTGVALCLHYEHEKTIDRVESEIIKKLAGHTWAFDQIYVQLSDEPSRPDASEALSRAVSIGAIQDKL
jgi:hypothetical protein